MCPIRNCVQRHWEVAVRGAIDSPGNSLGAVSMMCWPGVDMSAARGESDGVSSSHAVPRPKMYGYVRAELAGDRLDDIIHELHEFAAFEHFELVQVFIETGPTTGALWQLTQALEATRSRDVITPTPTHLEGGGNPQRHKLSDIIGRENDVWYLDRNDDAARHRAARRYRDIPPPGQAPAPESRNPIGCIELHTVASSVALAQLRIHELLTRAHLRHLVAATEQVVQAVLAEATAATAAAEPAIYAELADSYPVLAPPHNILTVALARSRDWLEIQIAETASRAAQPMDPAVCAVAEGRRALATGGTLTWARVPLGTVPAVLPSSLATCSGREPLRTAPPPRPLSAPRAPDGGRGLGESGWGASTSYEIPAVSERLALPATRLPAGRSRADSSEWRQ